jgi:hypothetical protein
MPRGGKRPDRPVELCTQYSGNEPSMKPRAQSLVDAGSNNRERSNGSTFSWQPPSQPSSLKQRSRRAPTRSTQNSQSTTPIPQQIRQKLQSAGYSDMTIMPISFVVQAKDKQGDPVEILVTPHSMMEITALNASEQNELSSSGHSHSTGGNQLPAQAGLNQSSADDPVFCAITLSLAS